MRSYVYLFLSIPITFFLIEIVTRFLIWFVSMNIFIWGYGIDTSINFEIESLKKFDFLISKDIIFAQSDQYKQDEKKNDLLEIWAFGGSTTFGFNCGEASSSWPSELNELNLDYKVTNFAKNGSNSDFAYYKLLENLNKGHFPDMVIWAGRVNELDVITRGFKRNKENVDLSDYFFDNELNNFFYNIKVIDKTIKKYSVFYNILDGIVLRLKNRINVPAKILHKFTDEELKLAALNYKLNTKDAIKLSEIYDFKFAILTLINKKELDSIKMSNWDKILNNEVTQLSNSANTYWIDTRNYTFDYKVKEDLFCDNFHQTLQGNIQIAKNINKIIDQILKK